MEILFTGAMPGIGAPDQIANRICIRNRGFIGIILFVKSKLGPLLIALVALVSHSGQAQTVLPSGTTDLGAQINAAMQSFPASGGRILIQPAADGGCYSFTTPIVVNKAVIIQGQGPATCLAFTGTGTAVTFSGIYESFVVGGGNDVGTTAGFGLRDLTLRGTGPTAGQTALALGGSTNTVGFYGSGVTITNFGLGLQFLHGVWNFKIENSIFNMNGQSVLWPASIHFGGENIDFDHVTFSGAVFANSLLFNDSDTDFSNLNSLTFVSCNFDSAQLVIGNGSGSIRLYSAHFENAGIGSGSEPLVRIRAFTAATDVVMDGPDFYNDQNNPYPPDFVEIDGGPMVTITQMRSVNLDGTTNVPSNVLIDGSATVNLIGDAPLRATKSQYVVASGYPTVTTLGGVGDPALPAPQSASAVPIYNSIGASVQNVHITTGKVILPGDGQTTAPFPASSQFSQTPTCTVSYQTGSRLPPAAAVLSANPWPYQIQIFGQPYIGVYYVCVGN